MKTVLAVAFALALAACSQEDEDGFGYPPVESRYSIEGGAVECRGTVDETWTPETEPTEYRCTWERVTVGGQETCFAVLVFERDDAASPWSLASTFTSDATSCL